MMYTKTFEHQGIFFTLNWGFYEGDGIVFDYPSCDNGQIEKALSDPADRRMGEIFQWVKEYEEYFDCLISVYCWLSEGGLISQQEQIEPKIKVVLRHENTGIISEVGYDQQEEWKFREGLTNTLELFKQREWLKRNKREVRMKMSGNLGRVREYLKKRDGSKCAHCEEKEGLEVDHIFPVSRGGGNDYENLQLLCASCNAKKGSKVLGTDSG